MAARKLGDIEVRRVLEMVYPFDAFEFFPDTSEADWAPHREWLRAEGAMAADTNQLVFPMQGYLVRTRHHTILIDTCIGNHKERPHRPGWHQKTDLTYLSALRTAGVTPEDIDYVMCTHLHGDHVGWNTKLVDGRWVPTFPNAKYLISGRELEVWRNEEHPAASASLVDSVLPVVEAGQAELVSSDHALDDEVWLEPTPGHTPDHYAVNLASGGQRAVVGGDSMHSPVQCLHPDWRAWPDWDPALARETRRRFMEGHAEGSLVCMMHFPLPSAGRFVAEGKGFRFRYDETEW